jgi:hypothetical protein
LFLLLVCGITATFGAEWQTRFPDKLFFVTKDARKFDEKEWLNNSPSKSTERIDMLSDLMHTKPLIGMTRAEIHALLGQPSLRAVSMLRDELQTKDFDPYELCARKYLDLKYSNDRVVSFRIDCITAGDKHMKDQLISASSRWYTKNF